MVPLPHALLAQAAAWRTLAFHGPPGRPGRRLQFASRLIAALPPLPEVQLFEGEQQQPQMTPDKLVQLADFLRSRGRGGDTESQLERWVCFLEKMAEALTLNDSKDHGNRHWIWKARILVDTILIAEVASAHQLQNIVVAGMRVVCPGLAEHVATLVDKERQMPSAPTISRHRLSLHTAFLLALRTLNDELLRADLPARYTTCDASPQCGREWLLSGSLVIAGHALQECYDCAVELIREAPLEWWLAGGGGLWPQRMVVVMVMIVVTPWWW